MKRLLFQLSSIICCVILLSSCEQEDVIIDNIQYINSPNCCLSMYKASWNGSTLKIDEGGYITFKTKITGTLLLDCEGAVKIYQNGKKIHHTDASKYRRITIKHIPANAIIKIKAPYDSYTYTSFVSDIAINSNTGNSNTGTSIPDSGFDF